jgi:hypothetical protein
MKKEIRITVRCTVHEDHAKILKLDPALGFDYATTLAGLLDGSSPFYIFPPGGHDRVEEWPGGKGSPIGRCALCGAPFTCTVSEIGEDAKSN